MGKKKNIMLVLAVIVVSTLSIIMSGLSADVVTVSTGSDFNETCVNGSCLREIYAGKINYYNGINWKKINSSLNFNGTDYLMTENDFNVIVRGNKTIIEKNGHYFLLRIPTQIDPIITDNRVFYNISKNKVNATATITLTPSGIETMVVLQNYTAAQNFVYNVSTLKVGDDFVLENPYIWDSSGDGTGDNLSNTYNTSWVNNNGDLSIEISKAWLNTVAFPVYIDPTVTMAGNNASCWSAKGASSGDFSYPTIGSGTALTAAENTSISLPDKNVVTQAGTASSEAYVLTNCTLPANSAIDWIFIKTSLNSSSTDTLNFSYYNYTAGAFMLANWSAASVSQTNLTKNITNGLNILEMLKAADNRTITILPNLKGSAASDIGVDFSQIIVSYRAAAADTTAPQYSLNATSKATGTQYNPSNNYGFQTTWTDTTGVDKVLFETNMNATLKNFSASLLSGTAQSGVWGINFTGIGAGTYQYRWYANDTGGYMNASFPTITYSVAQNQTNPIELWFRNSTNQYLNQNMSVISGTATNSTAMMKYFQSGTLNLYYDHVLHNDYNNTNQVLAVATYNITANSTGNTNYTGNSTSWAIIVNALPVTTPYPYFTNNITTPNSPQTYNPSLTLNIQVQINDTVGGFGNISKGFVQLGRANGNMINFTLSNNTAGQYWYNFTQALLGQAGTLNLTYFANNTKDNWNSSDTVNYVISQNTTSIYLAINGTQGNRAFTYPAISNVTGWGCLSELTCSLYNNSVAMTNPDVSLHAVGTYTFDWNTSGNANYTSFEVTRILTIEPIPPKKWGIQNSTGDWKFWIDAQGDLHFNNNNYIKYGDNNFNFYVGGSIAFCINATGGFNGGCQ